MKPVRPLALVVVLVGSSGASARSTSGGGLIAFTRYRVQKSPLGERHWVARPEWAALGARRVRRLAPLEGVTDAC